ncbi:MAG: DUF3040 domain-containing protein [Microbacteriaceae bacterium]|nr:DUF3040 domain-containing protein [Microbacteriaceae bacterium]
MALSEREQRLLEEMERNLYKSDADFVERPDSFSPSVRNITLGVVTAVVGIGIMITGVSIQTLWLGIIGFAVMFLGVLLTLKQDKTKPAKVSGKSTNTTNASKSFMQKAQDRWEKRQNPDE